MRNVELLQATMQHILDHPEEHDQTTTTFVNICGTAACFAGHAALLSGWTVHEVLMADMWRAGAELLGITHTEAGTMFSGRNTRAELELMVKDLVNGDELRARHEYQREAHHA